jgi:cytochrome bd-type quinol oxidase subunit 2
MLGYVSLSIGLCTIAVTLVFGLTWVNLYNEIRVISSLQEEFRTAGRRLIGNIGLFAIPISLYLLNGSNKSMNNSEPFAFAWSACYVVNLLMLAASLTTLVRDAKREKKTGLYRFRR